MDRELELDFVAFVEARTSALFRTAVALTGHHQQAEDLLQTVLARTYQHWARIRAGHPEAYVRRAMYLQCVSWWRLRSYRREVASDDLPEVPGADHADAIGLRMAVQSALRRLPARQRAVLVLRYLEDLPDADIAEIIGCERATVRSHVARARDRLRQLCPDLGFAYEQDVTK
jgi:RNA polymerase sigma-70 factor (sigma-E family)